jgi:PhoH-like ATPase
VAPRTYVLDTSVLLSDPKALQRFEEHDVVLPVVVLMELEAKRHHPDLGWAAREVLRALEHFRVEHGSLTEPIAVTDGGGSIRVELNHQDRSLLPDALRSDDNDHRILAVARNLAADGRQVTVVTKDLPLRLKASIAGLDADEYRNEQLDHEDWTGFTELAVDQAAVDELFDERVVDLDAARDLPCNTGVALSSGSQSGLGRVRADKRVHLVRGDRSLFDLRGRSAEQRVALDLLADPEVGIISLGGRAGTGKSVLALAAGLDAVLEQRTQKRVVVFRPLFAVGGQDLGYLPGDRDEKMAPWGAAVVDALDAIAGPTVVEEVLERGLLEVLPLTHIRGRNLNDTFVIIDEAQNLERTVLLTALSRLGEGSRVVLTHDVAQRDNLRVGRHDGITSVIAALAGHPLFGHVTLHRSERSPIAALVTTLLDPPD